MPALTLKVDVDTFRGTREGVPALARMLLRHGVNATFLFSLGPDHTGWALRRVFRPGFFRKVSRTSVVEHYGVKTLLYGVLLPAPDIGALCAGEMRAVESAGFECGIHSWDHVSWHDNVRLRDAEWTRKQMTLAFERFAQVFGHPARTHGAAGWQMNPHAFALLDEFGIAYSSDGRAPLRADGRVVAQAGPYRVDLPGKPCSCVQMPTTLPTLDELLGRKVGGVTLGESNIASALLSLTETPRDHLFTLHAELEGQKLAPILDELLGGWRAQGYNLGSMGDNFQRISNKILPLAPVEWGHVPGRSGELVLEAMQPECVPPAAVNNAFRH